MKAHIQTIAALTLTLLCGISPSLATEQTLEAESIRLVSAKGLQLDAKVLWLENEESHGVAFVSFSVEPDFFDNLDSLDLLLQSADHEDAESKDGFSVIMAGQQLGGLGPVKRHQALRIPLDPNGLGIQEKLNMVLVPSGPDGVGLLPQARLEAHYAVADPLKTGLIAEYLFSGNYQDTSGSSHHGTPSGPCELAEDRFGQANSALRLTGNARAMVTVTHTEALTPEHLTLSAWVCGDTPKLWARILHKFNYNRKVGYAFFYCHTNQTMAFESFGQDNKHLWLATQATLQGRWQHLVFTYNGKQGCFYVNGKLDKTIALEMTLKHTDQDLILGNGFDGSNHFPWKGSIDDLRIYDRALSETDIQALYSEQPKGRRQLMDLKNVDRL